MRGGLEPRDHLSDGSLPGPQQIVKSNLSISHKVAGARHQLPSLVKKRNQQHAFGLQDTKEMPLTERESQ